MAVEIVVTHDLDETTVARYAHVDLPAFIVRPTWDTVSTLRNELTAADAFISRSERCPTCREEIRQEREHEQRVERLRQKLDNAPMLDYRIAEASLSRITFSSSASAAAGDFSFFSRDCPSVPMRPKWTQSEEPFTSASQNL